MSAAALPELNVEDLPDLPELTDIIGRARNVHMAPGRRLIAIVRVSKMNGRDAEAEGFIATPEQRRKIKSYAEAHGCEIVDEYEELDISGGKIDRDALDAAYADVAAGKADGIIVAYLSRYARTTAGLQFVRKLQAGGKAFVSVDEGIGPEMLQTSMGWFQFTIMLAVAELQLAMLTEGFLAARRAHVAAGIANQTPYGYRKRPADAKDKPRRLEPDPKTSKYVTFMFDRRGAGDSWITIAKALDRKGAPVPGGGKVWLYTRVRAIVTNRVYLGELTSGEFVNEKAHFPLVSVEQWTAANTVNQTPARNDAAAYALTGIVRCATCGGRMVGFMQTIRSGRKRDGEKRTYPYYRCRRNYGWGVCPAPASCPAGELEALVVEEFFRRFTRDLDATRRADDRSTELAEAQAAIDKANAEYDRFTGSPATARTAELRGQGWYDAEVETLQRRHLRGDGEVAGRAQRHGRRGPAGGA